MLAPEETEEFATGSCLCDSVGLRVRRSDADFEGARVGARKPPDDDSKGVGSGVDELVGETVGLLVAAGTRGTATSGQTSSAVIANW